MKPRNRKKLVVLPAVAVGVLLTALALSLFLAPSGWSPAGEANLAAPNTTAHCIAAPCPAAPSAKPSTLADSNDPNYGYRPAQSAIIEVSGSRPNGCGASPDNCRTTADAIWPDRFPGGSADLYAPYSRPSIVASLPNGSGGPSPDPTAVEYGS